MNISETEIISKVKTAFLSPDYFSRGAEESALNLLGRMILTDEGGKLSGGIIVETEAYGGFDDPGSHAYSGITPRNSVMLGPPGTVYVYLCYGASNMLNIVTGRKGRPEAVLLRALQPAAGIEAMTARRGGCREQLLAKGPGRLAQALGITRAMNGLPMGSCGIMISRSRFLRQPVSRTGRIGIKKGEGLPLRFIFDGNKYVSKG